MAYDPQMGHQDNSNMNFQDSSNESMMFDAFDMSDRSTIAANPIESLSFPELSGYKAQPLSDEVICVSFYFCQQVYDWLFQLLLTMVGDC